HRPVAGPPPRQIVGRRAPARRARPRTVVEAATIAPGRTIGVARRRAQDRNPALSRAPARRSWNSDGLCQSRRSRTAPGGDADRDAPARTRHLVRRRQGADAAALSKLATIASRLAVDPEHVT